MVTREELEAMGIEDPDDLRRQEETVRAWNELVYSGALDRKGTQVQFVRSVTGGARA